MFWLSAAKWIGTSAGVSGAIVIALDLGIVVYGFALFLLSSLLWGSVAPIQGQSSLAVLQGRIHGDQPVRFLALGRVAEIVNSKRIRISAISGRLYCRGGCCPTKPDQHLVWRLRCALRLARSD